MKPLIGIFEEIFFILDHYWKIQFYLILQNFRNLKLFFNFEWHFFPYKTIRFSLLLNTFRGLPLHSNRKCERSLFFCDRRFPLPEKNSGVVSGGRRFANQKFLLHMMEIFYSCLWMAIKHKILESSENFITIRQIKN